MMLAAFSSFRGACWETSVRCSPGAGGCAGMVIMFV